MKNIKPFGPSLGKTKISKKFLNILNKEIDNKVLTKNNDYSSKLASQIKINKDALLAICIGYPAFIKNRIGLKKIPPPIPTIPDIKPIIDPIEIDINFGIWLILIFSSLKDLLSISKKMPATNKTQNNKISNKLFSIFIDPPIKAKGIEPIK